MPSYGTNVKFSVEQRIPHKNDAVLRDDNAPIVIVIPGLTSDSAADSRSSMDFFNNTTRVLAKLETVDAYYRRASCVNFMGNVSVPLLCGSALDDPFCGREAIPWDECRPNENIILATTEHGGHLAYYERITASSLWWVKAVDEFFHVLHSSPLRNKRNKMERSNLHSLSESSIDRGPFVNVMEDGMVITASNIHVDNENEDDDVKDSSETICDGERNDNTTEKTKLISSSH